MPPTPGSVSVSLCLACSASLPPRKVDASIYHTPCCSRPICPRCVSANPRLTRYNPCLRCLAGVNAVNATASSYTVAGIAKHTNMRVNLNVDAAIRDEDIFVVEGEDDSDNEDAASPEGAVNSTIQSELHKPEGTPPEDPSRVIVAHCNPFRSHSASSPTTVPGSDNVQPVLNSGLPSKYFIRPDDTLLGISLKLGIDGRVLCRLNNLPVSTLRTTPHLLHTRSVLVLPPSSRPPPPLSPSQQQADEERRARLARERAETRFQTMTKETDRDVAKAYVALAGLPDGEGKDHMEYEKEKGLRRRRAHASEDDGAGARVEGRAIDHYYDDEEWEGSERAEGRKPSLPPFPYGPSRSTQTHPSRGGEDKSWWHWKS
ncbi:hypothetical protein GY45DRAFT_1438966 [Cubamyces sp. BRFM 1775]|nr:hypothetical protein GY45DRAFT_1438966 [Cubamyces sp. BRFM 1775]